MAIHITTPTVESDAFSTPDQRVWLKLEALQPCGSFKLRGIGHACEVHAARGATRLLSSSGGNAGIAVAYAGRRLGLPVVVVVPSPRGRSVLHDKIVSNIQEIRARGARTIVIAEEGDEAVVPYADHLIRIPATPTLLQPLVATVPLQVFACELATARGNEVDQPRNLAKSVTVE